MVAMARQHGSAIAALPGITMDLNAEQPLPAQGDDESVVYHNAIAVSPMHAGFDAGNREIGAVSRLLRSLFSARKDR